MAQFQYSGVVTSVTSGLQLEGVTVSTNTGEQTTTNTQGYFELDSPNQVQELIFRHLGFQPKAITNPASGAVLQVQMQQTSNLQEVVVTAYGSNRPLLQTAGAISTINSQQLNRFDGSSLVRAVNTVPGVKMDERTPASYRLSVRGSTLRSPYGIRNVKVYFNGIPYTEANGTTALNLIDANAIRSIEILKGPAGSMYGAGTGGTVLLEPIKAKPEEQALQVGTTIGSYGFRKYEALASLGSDNSSTVVQYVRQEYDGYREHSAMQRDVVLVNSDFTVSDRQELSATLLYSNLFYELPGGLTQEQYQQNPKQARGGKFGSIAQNASINLDGITIGLKHTYNLTDNFSNTTALYGLHKFKDNPFNTDYERNTNQEIGGRTSFVYNSSIANLPSKLTFGGEYQRGFEVGRTYDNNAGTPGNLRTDDEVIATTGFLFAQAELWLPADIIATAGFSLNDTRYQVTRLQQAGTGSDYIFDKNFKTVLSPRVALLKRLTDKVSLHTSISSGFSPPTEEEILTSDGVLNTALEAEKGTNYEVGIRGLAFSDKLNFDITAFYLRLKETIVSRQDASSVAVFRNVGSTSQKGIEASLAFTLLEEPEQQFNSLKSWASYTYSHFRFKDYQKDEDDLSGNALTGVAPHMLTAGLDLATRFGWYLNLTTNYADDTPLNDENTVYADSYLVFGARTGIRRELGNKLAANIFFGVDNLTDQKYSLGNDLNAFGGRYFQPAPARNFFGGVNLTYKL